MDSRYAARVNKFISETIAWYLGISGGGPLPSEGRLWRIEASWNWETWPISLLAGSLVLVIGWLAYHSTRKLPRVSRMICVAAHSLVVVGLTLLILQVRVKALTYGQPTLAVVLDTSASMETGDVDSDLSAETISRRDSPHSAKTRIELAKELLSGRERSAIADLMESYQVDFYTFDESLNGPTGLSESDSGAKVAIDSLAATGQKTNLIAAIETLKKNYRGRQPAAALMLTDGIQVPEVSEEAWRKFSRQSSGLGFPVFCVATGSARSPVDVEIVTVDFDPVGFSGDDAPISVDVSTNRRIEDNFRVRIESESAVDPVLERVFSMGEENQQTIDFVIPELETGRNSFRISVEAVGGEIETANNAQEIVIHGRDTQLNVLLVDHFPRWEYRHLKSMLERDRNINLKTNLISSDIDFATEDRTAILRLPSTYDDLAQYDALILGGQVIPDLSIKFLTLMRDYLNAGGGLVLFSGGDEVVENANLSSILPLEILEVSEQRRSSFRPRLTVEGRAQRIFSFVGNDEAKKSFPDLYVRESEVSINPAALVLMNARTSGGREQPILATMRIGQGHVVQNLFDDSWRWRSISHGNVYRRFWSQLVRLACQKKFAEQLPIVELNLDVREKSIGMVTARIVERIPGITQTGELLLNLLRDGRNVERVDAPVYDEHTGTYSHKWTGLKPGEYRVDLKFEGNSTMQTSQSFTIENRDLEHEFRPVQRSRLQEFVAQTEGKYYSAAQFDDCLRDLPAGTGLGATSAVEIPIWTRWELLLFILLFAAIDWSLRRRHGVE